MADEMKPFVCSYRYEGRLLGFTVEARSFDEVSARLRAIGMAGGVDGEPVAEIDAGPIGSGFGRVLAKVRALVGGRGQ